MYHVIQVADNGSGIINPSGYPAQFVQCKHKPDIIISRFNRNNDLKMLDVTTKFIFVYTSDEIWTCRHKLEVHHDRSFNMVVPYL